MILITSISKQAKAIEGSAVVNGSNPITPTISTGKIKPEVEIEEKNEQLSAVKAFLGIQEP